MSGNPRLPRSGDYFLDRLADLQDRIRSRLETLTDDASTDDLAAVADPREGDTIFGIDLHAEDVMHDFFAAWGDETPLLLIAEGIPGDGGTTFPEGTARDRVAFTCIVDPIDGTRGLMYGKRSGWTLAGIAPPPRDALPALADIEVAMQTELPTPRSHLSDRLWAVAGQGVQAQTRDMTTGERRSFQPRPSRSDSLLYGFGTVAKFFPGGKTLAAEIEERLAEALFGKNERGEARFFDDEYICSGGQLYELTVGHDRFIADLRPLLQRVLAIRTMCAHPYDLCTELIAREAGVLVTDGSGGRLRDPLDVRADCTWIGYANERLRSQVEPVLRRVMTELGLPANL